MNELTVSLPQEAVAIRNDVSALEIIEVNDERTNIAASENLKLVNQRLKAFKDACEPERLRLREPLDQFLALKKEAEDAIETWIAQQKKTIGAFAQEIIRKENERRAAEQKQREDEFLPAQDVVVMDQAKVKTEFVSSSVKEKPSAAVTDKVLFINTLISTGNISWVNLIFDKVNQSKLNEFCKANSINGRDKLFPGLSVEMIADVRVR